MKRRSFLFAITAIGSLMPRPVKATLPVDAFEAAAQKLQHAVDVNRIRAAVLHVDHRGTVFSRAFGTAASEDAVFLLASITKPMVIAAVLTFYDQGKLDLDDPVHQHIDGFRGDGRERITVRHLMTHTSGLPDQTPDNRELRERNAPLRDFVASTLRTPLSFEAGLRYQYSSMGILLAAEIASRLDGGRFIDCIQRTVFQPLQMERTALGLGDFTLEEVVPVQTEFAAPEAGGGDPNARTWDWNSRYWRQLGAPWGGAHGTAADVAKFMRTFLRPDDRMLKPETKTLMSTNQLAAGFLPRGLGFGIGPTIISTAPANSFGHSGSTGTLVWANKESDTICVVLTSLPATQRVPHPRNQASDCIAKLRS